MPWAQIAAAGASFLGGLLGGDKQQQGAFSHPDAPYFSMRNLQEDSRHKSLMTNYLKAIAGDRPRMFQGQLAQLLAQTGQVGAETDLLRQLFGQREHKFKQQKRLSSTARRMMKDKTPIFNVGENMGLLQAGMQPQMNQLAARFGQSGMGGGAALGAALNLQNQTMAPQMFQAQQRNAYAMADRNNWLMNYQAGLFG